MSHLILKKKGTGYRMYDKNKKSFVGAIIKTYKKAQQTKKSRDVREDKVLHKKK